MKQKLIKDMQEVQKGLTELTSDDSDVVSLAKAIIWKLEKMDLEVVA